MAWGYLITELSKSKREIFNYNCYSYSVQGSAGYGLVPDFQGLRKYTMEYGKFDLNYIYV